MTFSNPVPETRLANAPEALYDPRATPPEVPLSTAPEHDHDPQGLPPELAPSQAPEARSEASSLDSANQRSRGRRIKGQFSWTWILVVGLVVIAVGIRGGIGGSDAQKRRFSSSSSSASASSPLTSSNSSANQFKMKGAILPNTSIAAVSCVLDDRWVFMQNVTGAIQGAHWSTSNQKWYTITQQLNYTPAKVGTALSASCVNLTDTPRNYVGSKIPGLYISLIYLDQANALQQTVYNGGIWIDAPVYPDPHPPSNNTRLFTSIEFPVNSTSMQLDLTSGLSSVAVYQSNRTLMMVNVDPDLNVTNGLCIVGHMLVENLVAAADLKDDNIGFACLYNPIFFSYNSSPQFLQCYTGDGDLNNLNPNSFARFKVPQVGLRRFTAGLSIGSPANTSEIRANGEEPITYGPSILGTDISMIPLTETTTAVIFLQPSNTIALGIRDNSDNSVPALDDTRYAIYHNQSSWGTTLPYSHFSATKMNMNSHSDSLISDSALIFIYYQFNGSWIGEVTYNTVEKTWASVAQAVAFS